MLQIIHTRLGDGLDLWHETSNKINELPTEWYFVERSVKREPNQLRSLALLNNEPVGFAYAVPGKDDPLRWQMSVRVADKHIGQGIRLALYNDAMTWIKPLPAKVIAVFTRDTPPHNVEFWLERGWKDIERNVISELDISSGVSIPQPRAVAGLEIVRLVDHPELLHAAYAVSQEIEQDMPGEEPCSLETFDEWNNQWSQTPGHQIEAALLALLDGELVGWSMIEIPPLMKGAAWHMSTGVMRNYRGRGIAQVLKYETLLNARSLGVTSIHTGNHTENTAMLHINNKLGYRRAFDQVMLLREVAP